jgi:hypothetical protein
MKTIIYIILLFTLSIVSCKAQSPIISLYDGSDYADTANAYYKDTDNDFDRFIGTWEYNNGSEKLRIIIRKKEQYSYNGLGNIPAFYADYLYGEYLYKDSNGNELVNTLTNIDSNPTDISEHLIFGNTIDPSQYLPSCENCDPNERSIFLAFYDPVRDYIKCELVLRTIPNTQNSSINDLKAVITGSYSIIPEGSPTDSRIPYGKYVMIKQ